MGHFTDEMLRLRQAANAAKQRRVDLVQHLQQFRQNLSDNTTTFLTDFQNDFAAQSQQRRSERQDFVNHIATTIAHFRDDCHRDQQARKEAFTDMTQTCRANREQFVSQLKQNIGQMREDLNTDRAEARRIWLELSTVTGQQPVTVKQQDTKVTRVQQSVINEGHQVIRESENFVTGLKQTVSNMVQDFRAEMGRNKS